jgi:dTDP-4-amino-4,6-dideoxygalactose transaminase
MPRVLEREVESFMARHTGRESLYMSSGRVALYCVLTVLFSPGDAILMSPVNDDVIFFVVLAAGLQPVAVPLSAADGNIDVNAISETTWSQARGVLTTNLYGFPDDVVALRRQCDVRGLQLVEDVAHAIEGEVDGRPLGTFGAAGAFSLSKHIDAYRGGVLTLADAKLRPEIERVRSMVMTERSAARRVKDRARPIARAGLQAVGVMAHIRRVREAAAAKYTERPTGDHRMALHTEALRAAVARGGGLAAFDPWVRVDRHDYQVRPGKGDLKRMVERLRGMDADRERRIEGVERLRRELDCVTPRAASGPALPLFRLPLLVADREAAMARLAARGVLVRYIYDPPLDDYAGPEFMVPSPAPEAGRWWVRHALPIDPLKAEEALPVLRELLPAAPPRLAA